MSPYKIYKDLSLHNNTINNKNLFDQKNNNNNKNLFMRSCCQDLPHDHKLPLADGVIMMPKV